MPFYEYECSACKFYVEVLQKVSDPPMKKCPSCKKQTLKKLVSAPVFRLKGGGWYETDFKSDQENKRNLVGEEKEAASESKSESATDKPVEKATETKSDAAKAKPASGVNMKKSATKPAPKPKPKPKTKAKSKPAAKKK
jgi:putative FmdB family regulatory protein